MNQKEVPELICQIGPITALTVCSQKVLWGCGNEICVFDLTTNKLEIRRQVLVGTSVHGIKIGHKNAEHPQLLCVYGSKQARVISVEVTKPSGDISFLSDIMEFVDWIWDVHWLTNQSDGENVAIAMAHNSVVRWNWQSGTLSSQRECVEKCILYCAHFIGNNWKNLILAAGTVFNQIVLWPVASSNQSVDEPVDVMHTFFGHQGVIFSIRYHSDLQRLCSVSDDRSIRMWQLTFPKGDLLEPTIADWISVKSDLLLVLYGHSARVWDVALTSTYFASVGEDATCCIWNYAGNILHKFKGHKGRSIWRLTVTEDEKCVLTGGGDGSIRLWEVHQEKSTKTFQRIVSLPHSNDLTQDDFPRIVKMLNFDLVLIMMNSGFLYSYCVRDQRFNLIVADSQFRSYSIVSPGPDQMMVALGSITGVIRIICFPEVQDDEIKHIEISLFSGKVLSLVWLNRHHFLTSGPGGLCFLHIVEAVQDLETEDFTLSMKILIHLALPPSKHRWITAACFVPAENEDFSTSLVCGDKDGSIHYYSFAHKSASKDVPALQPSSSFFRVHGKAGVTFVCYKDGILYTAGRDGFYRQWDVKAGNLSQHHGNKIIKGFEWIDRLEWYNNDLLVYGFFSSMFVVWSVSFNQQLMAVQCGGGHRAWGCSRESDMLRFVYLKAGKVYIVDSGHQAKQTILQPALHGRKLCEVKILTVLADKQDRPVHVVCSAGEDTVINIGAFVNMNSLSSWKPITSLKGHMSSIRALAVSSNSFIQGHKSNNLSPTACSGGQFMLFSGGGRAEIRAWKLSIHKDNVISTVENQENLSHNEINSACEIDQNPHLTSSNNDFALNSSSEDLAMPYRNNDVDIAPGHTISSTLPARPAINSSREIQCSYQHLSTHFLREPHNKRLCLKSRKLRLDPETRIMSLDASSLADLWSGCQDRLPSKDKMLVTDNMDYLSRVHILSCAGSDGVFRVFAFDEHSRVFSSLADSTYHQGCVLKVVHYVHSSDLKQPFAVSASTNGRIIFWSLDSVVTKLASSILSKKLSRSNMNCRNSESCEDADYDDDDHDNKSNNIENISGISIKEEKAWEPVLTLKAHQSGINSLHVLQKSESQLLLASGGDDNAVTVQLLEISDSDIKVMAKVTKEDAHAAQVTGIHLISSTLVVSVSIDQRVCLWSIQQAPGSQLQLQLMACRYISIADVSSMSVQLYKNSVYLSIGGEGLCLYRLCSAENVSQ